MVLFFVHAMVIFGQYVPILHSKGIVLCNSYKRSERLAANTMVTRANYMTFFPENKFFFVLKFLSIRYYMSQNRLSLDGKYT